MAKKTAPCKNCSGTMYRKRKYILLSICFMVIAGTNSYADQQAKTQSGELVILHDDGTWESETGTVAQPSENSQVQETSNEEVQGEILATATYASVDSSSGKNWDADLEDDGFIIYPELKDANDETVKFEGVELPVEIEIWTTERDDNFKEVKDRMVYSGSGTIDSWKDGNFMFDGGIKISFDDINAVESDSDDGALFVKIHTPDGQVFEAKSSMGIRIKPE